MAKRKKVKRPRNGLTPQQRGEYLYHRSDNVTKVIVNLIWGGVVAFSVWCVSGKTTKADIKVALDFISKEKGCYVAAVYAAIITIPVAVALWGSAKRRFRRLKHKVDE